MTHPHNLRLIEGGGNIVSFLEKILDRAKHGKIKTLALAIVNDDDCVETGITWGPGDPNVVPRFYPTLGAIEQLKHDLMTDELCFPRGHI